MGPGLIYKNVYDAARPTSQALQLRVLC